MYFFTYTLGGSLVTYLTLTAAVWIFSNPHLSGEEREIQGRRVIERDACVPSTLKYACFRRKGLGGCNKGGDWCPLREILWTTSSSTVWGHSEKVATWSQKRTVYMVGHLDPAHVTPETERKHSVSCGTQSAVLRHKPLANYKGHITSGLSFSKAEGSPL